MKKRHRAMIEWVLLATAFLLLRYAAARGAFDAPKNEHVVMGALLGGYAALRAAAILLVPPWLVTRGAMLAYDGLRTLRRRHPPQSS